MSRNILIILTLVGLFSCSQKKVAYLDGMYWAKVICEEAAYQNGDVPKPDDFPVDDQFMRIKYYTDDYPAEYKSFISGFKDYLEDECPYQEYPENQLMLMKNGYEKFKNKE